MVSSQRTTQSLFCGEAIWGQGKHYVMNMWDYFEQEAKKNGLLAKCTQKISKAISKGFQQQLEYINYTLTGILERSFATICAK